QGNPVGAGREVTFSVPEQVQIVEDGPYLSDADGKVVVHLTSTVAGTYSVSASVVGWPDRFGPHAGVHCR
ncbi:Ig-like domain-containing protein, partial [Bacillus licheniformis]